MIHRVRYAEDDKIHPNCRAKAQHLFQPILSSVFGSEMRHYHVICLQRLANLTLLTGLVVMGLSWFEVLPDNLSMLKISTVIIFLGLIPNLVLQTWLSFKNQHLAPQSPDALPVFPSGIWVDDETPLEIGTVVLAVSQGHWHKAVVIGFKSADRVIVHYCGWDHFWDEVIPRSKLQLVSPEPENPDTNFRAGEVPSGGKRRIAENEDD